MFYDGWHGGEDGCRLRPRRAAHYEGMNREDILADIDRRKAEIKVNAQRGLVRDAVEALLEDVLAAFPDGHDAILKEYYELEREGKKGEAGKYLEMARNNSTRIDVSHEIWKMESFLMNVVPLGNGESEEDWRTRAYPVLGTSKEEIERITIDGRINQAKTLLSIIRFLSAKGFQSLGESEKLDLAVCLKGLEISLSRANRNFDSIGARREELKPVRDLVGKVPVVNSYLHNLAWILKKYPEVK